MGKTLTVSIRNQAGAWEVIERENTGTSSQTVGDVTVFAHDIGGSVGQDLLVELRNEDDVSLDSVEITAS